MDTATKEQLRLEKRVVESYSLHATVPIGLEVGDQIGRHLGTGTLFTAQNKHFVITARHILFDEKGQPFDWKCLAIPHAHGKSQYHTTGSLDVHLPDNEDLDAVVLELKASETAAALNSGFRFTTVSEIGGLKRGDDIFLCGFPFEYIDPQESGDIRAKLLTVYSQVIPRPKAAKASSVPHLEFFGNFDTTGFLIDGTEAKTPELEGVSGCGIWQISEPASGGVWAAPNCVRLVGVQHAYNSTYFRAMSWEAVAYCFGKHHQSIAEEVLAAIKAL